jgi:tetratricopeptide (TPR) repeat protein
VLVIFFGTPLHALGEPAKAEVRAEAAPPEPVPPNFRALVDLGFHELASGNYAQARARFTEANAILPSARLLHALGMVEHELHNYSRATEYLDQALRSQDRPLTAEERVAAEDLSKSAREHIARYTLHMQPTAALVALDGQPVALSTDHSLWLDAGSHVLEAAAPNFSPLRRELQVEAQKDNVVTLKLQPAITTQPATRPRTSHLYESPWLWVGVAALATGAAVAIASVASSSGTPFQVGAPVSTSQTPTGAVIQLLRAP